VQRKRRDSFLTLQDRESISRGLVSGDSVRGIARLIMKSPSTVSREINPNGESIKYRAIAAEKLTLKKTLRPKSYKLQKSRPISKLVEAKLLDDCVIPPLLTSIKRRK
jgi:IS30 family transposase